MDSDAHYYNNKGDRYVSLEDDLAGWGIEQATNYDNEPDYYYDSDASDGISNDDDIPTQYEPNYHDIFFQQPQYISTPTALEPPRPSKNYGHRSTKSQTFLEPLILASVTTLSASSSYIDQKRTNLVALFRRSLSYNPSGRGSLETMRFVEKFRYLLVSSPLLDTHVSVHQQQQMPALTNRAGISPQRRQRRWAYRNSASLAIAISTATTSAAATVASMSPANQGTSAAMVLIVLLAWALKQSKRTGVDGILVKTPDQQQVLVVVVTFGTLLALFSYARRRALRYMRARVLEDAEALIDSCRRFDAIVLKNIAVLQELELIAANGASASVGGTRIGEALVLGKHLRATLSAVLYLALTASLTAIVTVLPTCNFLDLDKYLNIYELDISIIRREFCSFTTNTTNTTTATTMSNNNNNNTTNTTNTTNDDNDEMTTEEILRSITGVPSKMNYFGAQAAAAPVQRIREELQKVHFLRRLYTCCLLAQPGSGGPNNANTSSWRTWLVVDDSLLSLVELFDSLGVTLKETRNLDILSPVRQQQQQQQQSPVDRATQAKLGAVNELQQRIFQLESTLEVLRDELLADPGAATRGVAPPSVATVSAGIDDIVELWEHRPFSDGAPQQQEQQAKMHPPAPPPAPPVPLAPQFSPRPNLTHHRRHSSEFTTLSGATIVLEGTAYDRFSLPKHTSNFANSNGAAAMTTKLSRDERIAAMAQRRRAEAERKAEQDQKANLIHELGSVVLKRQHA
ncbi:similar to Yarrowia lipolytica YALI0E03124g [Yarrowia lipolytica CLIB 122] [Geotrichum candidum]|uniref:Similar to Yarrowia lipolytica YALI0E03124g [Yarrowia lipolytica CLIB 122] n=1 Tax=Geotrichum candidum TaxID=1173061 RepID=A0A0J9X331_GEOCN|nr:similar to Yarrowia lipolytica YALI0E03124g [Yarrowia lipolytica CLIB 122] [Geotrichum candidum]